MPRRKRKILKQTNQAKSFILRGELCIDTSEVSIDEELFNTENSTMIVDSASQVFEPSNFILYVNNDKGTITRISAKGTEILLKLLGIARYVEKNK